MMEPVQLAIVGIVSSLVSTIGTYYSTRSSLKTRLDRMERIQQETMRLLLQLASKQGLSVNPLVMALLQDMPGVMSPLSLMQQQAESGFARTSAP